MEKIEKLEGSYDVPQLKQKLNEIIDHLNSQDQVEEKPVDKLFRLRVELDKQGVKDYEHTAVETYKQATQDTPEQKEEWEEDFRGFLDFVIEDDSNKNEVVEYVKNLLDERETKAFNEGVKEMEDSEQIQADWDIEELGNIVDKIVKKLDKLNKKK
jgi:hypothetical protein